MADTAKVKTEERHDVKELIKTGKAFSFLGQRIQKAYETDDGEYYIEAVASSDQEDLVGDIMSSKALNVMKSEFVGKTVFMNHRTSVPDDVFGCIVEASLEKQNGAQLLVFKIVVENENEAAMKTFRVIKGGRVQLGTSVTVLVKAAKPNPNRKGGIIIDDVETIEHSIVGVPCNRESKTLSASASKALDMARLKGEITMIEETNKAAAAPAEEETAEPVPAVAAPAEEEAPAVDPEEQAPIADEIPAEETPAEQTPVAEAPVEEAPAAGEAEKALLIGYRDRAATARKSFMALVTGKAVDAAPIVVRKGMFNEILEQAPTFWELVYILDEVRWNLQYNIYLIQSGGSNDTAAVLSDWAEAIDEFKAAAIESFKWWNKVDDMTESKAADLVETAVEIEASLKAVVDMRDKAVDETTKQASADASLEVPSGEYLSDEEVEAIGETLKGLAEAFPTEVMKSAAGLGVHVRNHPDPEERTAIIKAAVGAAQADREKHLRRPMFE